MRTSALALLLACLPLGACSNYELATGMDARADTAEADNEASDTGASSDSPTLLRLDVYPSNYADDLENQSQELDYRDSWSDLSIDLDETITISGQVSGFDASPYIDIAVPGDEAEPLSATVRAEIPGYITGAAVETDEDGFWELTLPAADDYLFSVIAKEANLPMYVLPSTSFADGDVVNPVLDYGLPIFGLVQQSDGSTLGEDTWVRLVDPETGVSGPAVAVDDSGHYMLRAAEGTWLVHLEGEGHRYVPTRTETVSVTEEEGSARLDFDMGQLEPTRVYGEIFDASGESASYLPIRFTALDIGDVPGELVIERETTRDGEIDVQLLPGTWQLEALPTFDPEGESSPLLTTFELTGAATLPDITLPGRVELEIRVVDQSDGPVQGVAIAAQERGFDEGIYTTVTDTNGEARLIVPNVALDVRLTPPDATLAITKYGLTDPAAHADATIFWDLAQGQLIQGILHTDDEPVQYAVVQLVDEYDELVGTTTTNADGQFKARVQLDR